MKPYYAFLRLSTPYAIGGNRSLVCKMEQEKGKGKIGRQ